MKTLYIEDTKCPFCKNKMKHKIVYCPNEINLPCLACKHCKKYFYTEPYYNVLSQLAKNANNNLNKNVYKYQNSIEEQPINKRKIKNKQKAPLKLSKKPTTPQYKNTKNIDLRFQKSNNKLFLIIRLPIDYKKIHVVKGKYIFKFKSDTKDKKIDLRISLNNLESKINFLLDGFNDYIFPKSGILHIVLDDIPEITKNETPFNKMSEIIFIERSLSNDIGTVKLQIWLDKGLVASSIMPLYENISKNIIEPQIQKNVKSKNSSVKNNTIENTSMEQRNQKSSHNVPAKQDVGITAIVINDSRNCIFKNHFIDDVIAILRIATPNGNIKNYAIQAGYCNECDKYYILKDDFKMAQKLGSILCPVEDITKDKMKKQYNTLISSTESRIHELGYNVIKKNKLTNLQRRVILANIMENTDISKYEIKTNINRCIKQHQNQSNYAEAVKCWKIDYDFISNYKLGDMPQVKVNKIIIT